MTDAAAARVRERDDITATHLATAANEYKRLLEQGVNASSASIPKRARAAAPLPEVQIKPAAVPMVAAPALSLDACAAASPMEVVEPPPYADTYARMNALLARSGKIRASRQPAVYIPEASSNKKDQLHGLQVGSS
jgi:hypothetical protein